jgi:hypothetical protein
MSNTDDRARLDRRLDALIDDEIEAALLETQGIQREANAKGAFYSGRRIILEFEALRRSFRVALSRCRGLFTPPSGRDQKQPPS